MVEYYLLLYLAPLFVLAVPVVVATWTKWEWRLLDAVALALPGAIWISLVAQLGGRGRSLSNLIELQALAVAVWVLALAKAALERRLPPGLRAYTLLLSGAGLAVAAYLLFPSLDE